MPWHVTPVENVQKIMREGLAPGIGSRSEQVGEDAPWVHLFSSYADLESAGWLADEFGEEEQLALFHVAVPALDGAWTELPEAVAPEKLTLLSRDIDSLTCAGVVEALRALDSVVDPLADIESFRKTRVSIKAQEFGILVGDMQWEDEPDMEFLVYAAGYWIEKLEDGRHMLTIGNSGSIAPDDCTLEEQEAVLFEFAVSESRPLPEEEPAGDEPDL